jgi:hypothetical protein
MKINKIVGLLTATLIASCSFDDMDNESVLCQSYGVVKEDANTSGKLYVRSDEGKTIIPSLSSLLLNDDRESRVWIEFSTDDDINADTVRANVYDFLRITLMDFKTENDESTSDEAFFQDIWVAQNYLTMIMNVTANSANSLKNHKYTIMSNKEVVNDTVRMEFKYNRNNDANSLKFNKAIALKLDDKIHTESDSVILAIKYRANTAVKETFVTYKK